MQETSLDPQFVVDWEIARDGGPVIDLSAAEAEVVIPDTAELPSPYR
jgi:hypothetical protein